MREEDFYEEIANVVIRDLKKRNPEYEVVYSQNKHLPDMIREIEEKSGSETAFHGKFIPSLKLDILFGFKKREEQKVSLFLFEVKYANALQLMHYSQLVGYLDVAKKINVGVLFLVEKGYASPNMMTEDFSQVIQSGGLSMKNKVVQLYGEQSTFSRTIGICSWRQGARLSWYNTSSLGGITSLQQILSY